MMGLYQQKFVPADPPWNGRYVVWIKGSKASEWIECHMLDGEWRLPRGEGELRDVHYFIDLNGDDE